MAVTIDDMQVDVQHAAAAPSPPAPAAEPAKPDLRSQRRALIERELRLEAD